MYRAAPVVAGEADWDRSVVMPETAELWRRRAELWRRQRDALRAELHALKVGGDGRG